MTVWTVLFWIFIVCFFWTLLMGYGGIARLVGALFRLAGFADKMRARSYGRPAEGSGYVPMTVLLPSCESAENPVEYVEHHLKLDYPEYEVVVVCDGGKNATLAKLQNAFQMLKIDQPVKRSVPMADMRGVYRTSVHPNLIVIDKPFAGAHDALNCGVNVSRYPFVTTAGPNRWLCPQGLWEMGQPFTMQYECLVVCGLPRLDDLSSVSARLQHVNLLMDYPAGIAVPGQRRLPLVPGAYGAFRKAALIEQGGFAAGAGELDAAERLFVAAGGDKASVQMLSQPASSVLPRKGLLGLWRGSMAAQKELAATLWRCRGILFRPRFGRTGMWDVPSLTLTRILGPLLEVLGMVLGIVLFAAGVLPLILFVGFWLAMMLFAALTAMAALLCQQLEETENFGGMPRRLRDIGSALLYPLGYCQLLTIMRAAAMFAPKP